MNKRYLIILFVAQYMIQCNSADVYR